MTTLPTDWFPDHLQNHLTSDVVALLRAWLAEACRINGTDWPEEDLLQSLVAHVVASQRIAAEQEEQQRIDGMRFEAEDLAGLT